MKKLSLLMKAERSWGQRAVKPEMVNVGTVTHTDVRPVYRCGAMRFYCVRLVFGTKPRLKLLLEDQ